MRNFTGAGISFNVAYVTDPDNTAVTYSPSTPVKGVFIDNNGNVITGTDNNPLTGGTFTLNPNGTLSFDAGTAFDVFPADNTLRLALDYGIHGNNTTNGVTENSLGRIVVTATLDNGVVKETREAYFDFPPSITKPSYGIIALPATDCAALPDLQGYVNGLIEAASEGAGGSIIAITNHAGRAAPVAPAHASVTWRRNNSLASRPSPRCTTRNGPCDRWCSAPSGPCMSTDAAPGALFASAAALDENTGGSRIRDRGFPWKRRSGARKPPGRRTGPVTFPFGFPTPAANTHQRPRRK